MHRFFAPRAAGICSFAILVAMTVGSAQAGPINVGLVPVGDPGNAADSSGFGAVSYPYSIGKYDVTTSQYAAFLNSVATVGDRYGLWTNFMASDFTTVGISRNGSSGSFTYSVIGNGNVPIFGEGWGGAARFSNWLQNGQPTGVEGPGTTETGAYTLNGAIFTADLMAVTRNAGATYFIPTENEWYKAAYYKGGGTNAGYWPYPTQNNSAPSNALSATGTNNANFFNNGYTDPTNFLTSVGSFAASPGPYGTFDQGGDLFQWNETAVMVNSRGRRGGSYHLGSLYLSSSYRDMADPSDVQSIIGFRVASVASVPEPSSVILLVAGIVALTVATIARGRRGTTDRQPAMQPAV
jgi:formylglycine-generating enzyme